MGHKLAIDFGTTNSVVALYDDLSGIGRTVPIADISFSANQNTDLIPTLLYVNEGRTRQVTIGAEVQTTNLEMLSGQRLFRNFKRSIGADKNEARIIDGVPWTEMDAGKEFLHQLIASLPYPVEEIEQLVVTVPVAAFEGYMTWLRQVFAGFPPNRMRVVDESTAAALGYAITEPRSIVLVIDFGGGTLDLSLVRLPESRESTGKILFTSLPDPGHTAIVIAKAGIVLGGSDIDKWLLDWVMEQSGLTFADIGDHYSELLLACEQAKITLSKCETAEICFHLIDDQEGKLSFNRDDLEIIMEQHGFFKSLRSALDKVMGLAHQKGVYREDISHVLLVGGTSLIPSVQKSLDDYFRAITQRHRKLTDVPEWPALIWKVENTTIRVDKPFTAVVEGALLVSAGFGLDDHLTQGYGLCYFDPQAGATAYDEIIPMGSKYPSKKPTSLTLCASHSNQSEIALVIGQINTGSITSVDVQHQGGQTIFTTRPEENSINFTPLNHQAPFIVSLDPPAHPGKERLQAVFRVDGGRSLRVTITDLETHRKLVEDALVSKLGGDSSPDKEVAHQSIDSKLLPSLFKQRQGLIQLSLQKLASLFEKLPPEQLSSEVVAEALRSNDCLVRFSAAETLARRGDREARLLFEDILRNGQPHQRASAAHHIYHFSWFAANPLFEIALSDTDPRTREEAVFALCKMHQAEAYRRVMDILQNGTDAMRMAAVWGLQVHPDATAVPVLALAAQAESLDIRVEAMEVLGLTGSEEAIQVVQQAMNDPRPEVKYAATLSWVELAGRASFAPLAAMIETTTGPDLKAILRGLFHATNYMGIDCGNSLDADRLMDAFEHALQDSFPGARLAAVMQLAWMRHPRAEEILKNAFMNEPDSQTRAQMLSNIVNLMSPVANQLFEENLFSNDTIVRQTAEYLKSQQQRS